MLFAHFPFGNSLFVHSVAPFGEYARPDDFKSSGNGGIVFYFKRDYKVNSADGADDRTARAQVLERLPLFGAQKSVAVDDDGENIPVSFALQNAANLPGVEGVKPAAGRDYFSERRPQL